MWGWGGAGTTGAISGVAGQEAGGPICCWFPQKSTLGSRILSQSWSRLARPLETHPVLAHVRLKGGRSEQLPLARDAQ